MARSPTREDGLFVGRSLARGFSTDEIALQLTIKGLGAQQAREFIAGCQRKVVALTTGSARAADSAGSKLFHDGLLLIGLGVVITAATFLYASHHGGFYIVAFGPVIAGLSKVLRSVA